MTNPVATATPPAPAGPGFAALHEELDRLLGRDFERLAGAEQAAALRELSRAEAKIAAVRASVLAAAEKARTARKAGSASTDQWAAALTREDPAVAHRQFALAKGLQKRTRTASALADGELSASHAAVIVAAGEKLPAAVTPEQRLAVEAALVEKAKRLSPDLLRRVARRAIAAIEPDPAVVNAEENRQVAGEEAAARAKVRLSLHDNRDGTVSGHFTVPTLQGHLLRKVLQSMTAPRRARLGAAAAQSGMRGGMRVEPDRARGEAFCELLEHLPTDQLLSRPAATVVVTMTVESLTRRLEEVGRLDTGAEISAGEARRLACGAGIIPAVLGGASQPLDLGRSARLFSPAQRTALGLRHDTCAAEGCERPFAWCELHHHQPWAGGGKTDLAEAVPLCHFHHQRIHDGAFDHRRHPDGSIRFHRRA